MGKGDERGLLAAHLSEFTDSGDICATNPRGLPNYSFSMTNIGLQIQLSLLWYFSSESRDTYIAVLNCRVSRSSTPVGIYVKRDKVGSDRFSRIRSHAVLFDIDG